MAARDGARGVGQLIDVAGARDAQAVAERRRRERGLARRLERRAQLGPLVAAERERALGGLGDLGGVRHERRLLGGLAERREHRGLLHPPVVAEREPVAVDGDPAELGHVVGVAVVVLGRRPERAQEHEPVIERIGDEHAHHFLAGGGERLRGRRGREQLILARHGA